MVSPEARATCDRILDAAQACFAERGYAGTSLRWVADNAGVTQPLVSHYFGSKERLFEAVMERAIADYQVTQAEQFSRELTDPDFFIVGLLVLFRWLQDQREFMRLVQWARLEGRMPALESGVSIWNRVRQHATALIEAGTLRRDLDGEAAILFIDALMKGYWDRRDSYLEQLPVIAGDDLSRFERQVEHTFLLALVRAFFAPEHQVSAEARLHEVLEATPRATTDGTDG
ncbi:MAG: helix-turn-helix domain-containing protein [Myxococcota bacterium]